MELPLLHEQCFEIDFVLHFDGNAKEKERIKEMVEYTEQT
jgi:hypothetical protein